VNEDMESRPRSPYAATKLAGEAYARVWWQSFGVPTISLWYLNVYGSWQEPTSEYAGDPSLHHCLSDGHTPTVYGDGEQSRDFIYKDDVVDASPARDRCGRERVRPSAKRRRRPPVDVGQSAPRAYRGAQGARSGGRVLAALRG
jgi:hypothetical protein